MEKILNLSNTMIAMSPSANWLSLLNLIDQFGRLEWRKYQDRYKTVFIDGKFQQVDCIASPPYCSFRFEKEDNFLILQLTWAVSRYSGKVHWGMFSKNREGLSGRNWIICPKRFWAVRELAEIAGKSAGDYLAEVDPNFGPLAHEDLVGLYEFVQSQLQRTT